MKKIPACLLIMIIAISVYSQQYQDHSHRFADTAKIRPIPPPESERFRFYDNDTRLNFDITNDSSNLYLVFKVWDEMTQMRIMRLGMKITLKTKVKPSREVSINYPMGNSKGPDNGEPRQNQKMGLQEFRSQFLVQNSLFQADGFAFTNGLIPTRDDKGLHAAIQWDNSNNMIYAVRIPLKELFGLQYDINKIREKDIKLEVEEKAMERPMDRDSEGSMSERTGGSSEMMGGGMGGRGGSHGNGMRGMGSHGQGQDRGQMFHAKSFSQKFKLFEK